MDERHMGYSKRYRESLFGAISIGFFFLLIGALFIITPNLFEGVLDFFRDFDMVRVPNTSIYWLAPAHPRTHQVVYLATEQFSYALAIFQLVVLALRFFAGSPWSKKAETTGIFVFWIGTGYLTRQYLIETTTWSAMTAWFVFWSAIIMLIGVSLIVRAVILAAVSATRRAI